MSRINASRKRSFSALAITGLVVTLAACGGPQDNSAGGDQNAADPRETFKLTYATYTPESSSQAEGFRQWAEAVKEKTDGRVQIDMFYSEALLPATDILGGVGDGRADMGYVGSPYYPSELPLLQITGVPFLAPTYETQARALNDLYDAGSLLTEELNRNGVRLLTVAPLAPNTLIGNEPIDELSDLGGKRIRATGYLAKAVADAGGNAIGMSTPETYEALQRGILDMITTFPFDSAVDFGLHEVADHFTITNTGTSAATLNIISAKVWDSLPEDVQAAMTEASQEDLARQLDILGESIAAKCEVLQQAGVTVSALSDSLISEWRDKARESAVNAWISDSGADATQFLEEYSAAVENYSDAAAPAAICG